MSQLEERKSVNLNQQQGGMSPAEFAALHDLTVKQVNMLVKSGRIMGARKDARTKHWTIYPPAKILESIRQCKKRGTPFADRRLIRAEHSLKLINATEKFKVTLSGAQVLFIENNLTKVSEKLKRRCLDSDEFDDDAKASDGEKLNLLFTILAALKQAACDCGKFPPAARPQAAQSGFPTDTAERSNDPTEARAGAHLDVSPEMGIPEGGRSSAPSVCALEKPVFFLPGAFDVEVVHAQPEPRARAEHGERLGAVAFDVEHTGGQP